MAESISESQTHNNNNHDDASRAFSGVSSIGAHIGLMHITSQTGGAGANPSETPGSTPPPKVCHQLCLIEHETLQS